MNLFEYEGKEMMKSFGIPTPQSFLLADTRSDAPLPYPFVLKAQVMTGGRGKAGGVKVCHDEREYRQYAEDILHMEIKGHRVHGLLAEEMIRAERELYLSITLQGVSVPTLIASSMGGMDIEQVSREHPEKIVRIEIDPFTRLKTYQKKYLAKKLQISDTEDFFRVLDKIAAAFFDTGAKLVEINPLGISAGKLIAMDSKFVLDDQVRGMRETIAEMEQKRGNLVNYHPPLKETTTVTYVPLEGEIGLISDGAGTGMLTLDLLNDAGLSVASFCELGGMTSEEVMYHAMDLTLTGHPEIRGVIIVLIGGFNRMDNMALGITSYLREHPVNIPVFTRMCGTMEEVGLKTMEEAGMWTGLDLKETVQKLVKAVKEG